MFRVEDFTEEAIHDQPTRRLWTVDPPFDARVKDLVRDWGANKNPELIEEMIVTALKMARDEMGVADPKLINFNYFFARKLNFVKETHAFALFPGGFGTMDETFEIITLMQTGKARIIPIVLLDRPGGTYWETWMRFLTEHLLKLGLVSSEDFSFFKIAHDVDAAVREILQFYKIYHSGRWVGEQLVLRICQPLSKSAIADLNKNFADLIREGAIVQGSALRQEKNEPEIWNLPRLILTPYRNNFGRLRQLIDAINLASVG